MRVEEFISWEVMQDNLKNNGKFVIRPSAIQQFINCPAQWFRANIVGDFIKPAAAAEAGTALHKGAEIGYTEKIKTGNLPPVSVLTDVVVEEWKTLAITGESILIVYLVSTAVGFTSSITRFLYSVIPFTISFS